MAFIKFRAPGKNGWFQTFNTYDKIIKLPHFKYIHSIYIKYDKTIHKKMIDECDNNIKYLFDARRKIYQAVNNLPPKLEELVFEQFCYSPFSLGKYSLELNNLPKTLTYMHIRSTHVNYIPYDIIENLDKFHCEKSKFKRGSNKLFGGNMKKYCKYRELCAKSRKRNIRKIEVWFLDCKYNPKYKYCRDRLQKEYNDMFED